MSGFSDLPCRDADGNDPEKNAFVFFLTATMMVNKNAKVEGWAGAK